MGGALTLAALADGAAVDAGAPFYGIPDGRYFDVTKIKAPLLAQVRNGPSLREGADSVERSGRCRAPIVWKGRGDVGRR